MPKPDDFLLRELSSPIARELAEIQLISADIEHAFRAIDIWRKKYAPMKNMTPTEMAISLSLFRDAIVQFVGCFDRTAEFPLHKEAIYKTPDEIAYFDWLHDLRDTYAAHKFGPSRQCVVGVPAEGSSRRIHFISMIYRGPPHSSGVQLKDFIGMAGTFAANRMLKLIAKIQEGVNSLTDQELSEIPLAKPRPAAPSELRMSRSAFHDVNAGRTQRKRRSD